MTTPARKAFTVIELLIVIAILAILAAIVGFAMSGIISRSKVTATRVSLQNLRSMLSEFETAAKGLNRQPGQMWTPANNLTPPNTAIDIWRDADPTDAPNTRTPLLPAKNVTKDFASSNPTTPPRYTDPGVKNTQLVMGILKTASLNQKTLAQLPSNQLMSETIPVAGLTPGVNQVPNPPVVVDAWNNPILFVPAAGLGSNTNLQGLWVGYRDGDKTQSANYDKTNFVAKAPDNRPFWASAGPDGDFQKADDNIYSYEE